MTDRLDVLDYYTLLGVETNAGKVEVRRAFRAFARKYHPDRFSAESADKSERAAQIYRRGSEAYQVLVDPISRQAYDRVLRVGKTTRLSSEVRERAEAAAKPQPAKKEPAIRSPQARAYYNVAAKAARGGQWREAWKAMKIALQHEPGNRLLRSRMRQLEVRIRAQR